MTDRLVIVVPGEPVPQDRRATPRTGRDGRPYVGTYLLPKVAQWRRQILMRARLTEGFPPEPWDGGVRLSIVALFERPQRLLKASSPAGRIRKNTKPDSDNIVKSVGDALTPPRAKRRTGNDAINAAVRDEIRKGYLWLDDGQVHLGPVDRFYCAKHEGPGVIITVERIEEES